MSKANDIRAMRQLNGALQNRELSYVGDSSNRFDYEDEDGNIYEVKTRSAVQMANNWPDALYEQKKHEALKRIAKARGVNFYYIVCEPHDSRTEYFIWAPGKMRHRWEDRYCNKTTYWGGGKTNKKITLLDKNKAVAHIVIDEFVLA